jgi:hypothetical protein
LKGLCLRSREVLQSAINNQQSTIFPPIGNRKSPIGNHVTPASHLEVRPAPEMVSSGVAAIDALAGGLPRGCLTEICGPASSGRTTLLLAALAAATCRGEFCALVDAGDALDPQSAAAAGVDLDRLLWVRCGANSPRRHLTTSLRAGFDTEKEDLRKKLFSKKGLGKGTALAAEGQRSHLKRTFSNQTEINQISEDWSNPKGTRHSEHRLEQALRAADLLIESGGFGMVALDLADLPLPAARRIPLTTWFRFRRAVEYTPTVLLSVAQQPIAGSCSSLLVQLSGRSSHFSVSGSQYISQVNMGTVVCGDQADVDQAADPQRATAQSAKPTYVQLLTGLDITAELIRSRLGSSPFSDISSPLKTCPNRKPARSVSTAFASKTAWVG